MAHNQSGELRRPSYDEGMRRRRKQPSGASKRSAQRVRWLAENPHPYAHWDDDADMLRERIREVIGDEPITWQKSKGERSRLVGVDDLAVGLHAVRCVGANGLSYGQLSFAFQKCLNRSCHSALASVILRTLASRGIIEKIKNYSAGHHGICYRQIIPQNQADDVIDFLP